LSRTETAITTIAHPNSRRVIVGVDTHGDLHVACAIDQLGRRLAIADFATTPTDAVRRLPDSGFLGQDGAPSPEPSWQPPRQHRPVPDRGGPPALHQPTRDYLARRTKEGLSKREIIRC
jgi:hypothetical protein